MDATAVELAAQASIEPLFELDDDLVDRDAVTGLRRSRLDRRRLGRAEDILHLHRFHDRDRLARLDLVATFTSSLVRSPGIGARRSRDRSGAGFSIMCFDRSATCGLSTCTLWVAPRL